ncbi:chromatin structure-remodeling complex subunit RSC9 [Microdochium nivale]|nr:chromatin structure-remodeling complex subunit RSC9 [Microdochium nivale]
MAPRSGKKDEVHIHEIERTPEYTEFIQKLAAFHDKRGTSFEPEPRLPTMHGHVHVDLLQLYRAVIEKGGYDEISKVQKAWGQLANELGMYFEDNKGMGQLSFQLKQDFYRYLAAYWLQDQHGLEPPPKEILEQVSCASKYGPVLTRSIETFKHLNRASEETPTKEKDERPAESTPVSTNRASGRLREAPAQRVPFQPESGPTRPPRLPSSQSIPVQQSHGALLPHGNPHALQNSTNPLHIVQQQQAALRAASAHYVPPAQSENASRLTEAFEPRMPITVPLRPVTTPATNAAEFARRNQHLQRLRDVPLAAKAQIPGVGFDGPNIYTRCLQALRSEIPAEQAFALNHLVKISFERGDKYKFESFQGLAEGLIDKALEIGSLFYDVHWEVDYSGYPDATDLGVLDGLNGTDDILDRIDRLTPKTVLDHLQTGEFSDQFLRITEAVLTVRNMVMLIENASYMADVYPLKDLLCIILNLPNLEMLVEVKHFALDIAEQLTPFLKLESDNPLYRSLLSQLDSTDRGTILTALRAISRISMNSDEANKLQEVPSMVLSNIMNWLLLNDEELMDACLDFLYQYTAMVVNVDSLLRAVDMERVVPHLVRLLAHGVKRVKEDRILEPERKVPATEDVIPLPVDLQERLSNTDEPQRCFQWLQSLFEEDAESHITQIAIWQAYQGSFGALVGSGRHMLSAADFIRNVSHVFTNARAQIIRGPGEVQRFIIEGIRARSAPMDPDRKEEYLPCRWVLPSNQATGRCTSFFLSGEQMWHHILKAHLGIVPGEGGQIEDKEVNWVCGWKGCSKYPQPATKKLSELTRHIKIHVPSSHKRALSETTESVAKRQRRSFIIPAKTMSLSWEQTVITRDERNPKIEQAAGIPLSAVLVLRNIARNVVKTEAEEELRNKQGASSDCGGWNERLFRPVLPRLFEVMTENKAMATYITSLLQLVQED